MKRKISWLLILALLLPLPLSAQDAPIEEQPAAPREPVLETDDPLEAIARDPEAFESLKEADLELVPASRPMGVIYTHEDRGTSSLLLATYPGEIAKFEEIFLVKRNQEWYCLIYVQNAGAGVAIIDLYRPERDDTTLRGGEKVYRFTINLRGAPIPLTEQQEEQFHANMKLLSNAEFQVREDATEALIDMGSAIEGWLVQAINGGKLTEEAKNRANQVRKMIRRHHFPFKNFELKSYLETHQYPAIPREVGKPLLGISFDARIGQSKGVGIGRVIKGSSAEAGGLRKGDMIWQFNGQRVKLDNELIKLISEKKIGDEVKLVVYRNTQGGLPNPGEPGTEKHELTIKLGYGSDVTDHAAQDGVDTQGVSGESL
jgi:hypothetical protein